METWLPTLMTQTPQAGYELAIKLSRMAVKLTPPDDHASIPQPSLKIDFAGLCKLRKRLNSGNLEHIPNLLANCLQCT
jgi:Hexameric tyrosine-coordinated heme protein (HTHP)